LLGSVADGCCGEVRVVLFGEALPGSWRGRNDRLLQGGCLQPAGRARARASGWPMGPPRLGLSAGIIVRRS